MRWYLQTGMLLLMLTAAVAFSEDKPDAAAPGARTAVVEGNKAFAFDLYGRLAEQKGNLFLSPYNISSALAMTYAGANGATAEQMANTLHFPPDQEQFHPAFQSLMMELHGSRVKRSYELYVANALWGQKGDRFLDSFLNRTKQHYGAEVQQVDFIGNTEEARQNINAWVEKQTKAKIRDLIAQGVLNDMTRLVLTNAIYFKSPWDRAFQKAATKKEDFHASADQKVTTQMMHQHLRTRLFDGGQLQVLELPYKGNELSMLVLLPKKVDGLPAVEKSLSPKQWASWEKQLKPYQVDIALPKFTMTSSFSLKDQLSAMGMPDAFSSRADFSRMNGKKDLFISAILHKAFVDVNEEGTEAAAATGAVIEKSAEPPPLPRAVFKADHPFLFVIRHNATGSILFLGRVSNPEA